MFEKTMTEFLVQWALHEWPECLLDAAIKASKLHPRVVDRCFDDATAIIIEKGN